MEPSEKFRLMAQSAKAMIEDFNDDAEDRALAWASGEVSRLTLSAAESQREVRTLRQQLEGEKEAYQLSDKIATERMHKAEAERDEYKNVLERLILLKNYKDRCGKDNYYTSEQCEAWQQAKETLSKAVRHG